MDRAKETELDQLTKRASEAAVRALDARVDVQGRLHDLLRSVGIDPDDARAGGR
ncbi:MULTISPECIES: hypothetical protein [Actinoplanes]|uniref:hypothetical protein n=1 Tax=Actinoplanes TaxID=1865 RepID=UPI000B080BF3|nr:MULTISPECIES: hypothetical protein [Actinoplanes]GLY05041.1 hypothetical protein Acsp01_54200 [Actinoplanes sp. NBRC 101535]